MTGHRPFAELRARMSPGSQARAAEKAGALAFEAFLAEVRAQVDRLEGELAADLNLDEPRIEDMERQADRMVDLVRRAVEAAGGELRITFALPGGTVEAERLLGPFRRRDVAAGDAPQEAGAKGR